MDDSLNIFPCFDTLCVVCMLTHCCLKFLKRIQIEMLVSFVVVVRALRFDREKYSSLYTFLFFRLRPELLAFLWSSRGYCSGFFFVWNWMNEKIMGRIKVNDNKRKEKKKRKEEILTFWWEDDNNSIEKSCVRFEFKRKIYLKSLAISSYVQMCMTKQHHVTSFSQIRQKNDLKQSNH